MKLSACTNLALMLFLIPMALLATANAQTFSVLYSFAGGADGYNPIGSLIIDHSGNLFGTTLYGGNFGVGTAFRVDASGGEQVLHSFGGTGDGYNPVTELLSDGEGNLFGTTLQGGPAGKGVVFKLDENGFETILHSFFETDGAHPYGALAFDSSGSLIGTTLGGRGNEGVVFKLQTSGKASILYDFSGDSDGSHPSGGVIRDANGNLYGMASAGAFHGYGVVYKLDHSGQTVLHTFTGENDGKKPGGKLLRDADGNLYGMASGGKQVCGTPSGCGLIFRLAPNPDGSWTETVLHYFTGGADGAFPAGIVRDPLGNLYGIANGGGAGYGVVYKLDATGNQTVLYSFSGGKDGAGPSGLLRDDDGTLYGTTSDGGTYDLGTVFKISSN